MALCHEFLHHNMMICSGLEIGNWFLLIKDEVTNVLYICLAILPFLLGNYELKLRKVFTVSIGTFTFLLD